MKKIWFFSFSFRVIAVLAAIAMAISYLSPIIRPDFISLASIFGLYFIPILLINLILLILAIRRRSRSFWIPLIALLPSAFYITRFINYSSAEHDDRGQGISLLTYNVGRFKSGRKKMDKTLCLQKINQTISNEDPDIVCLQEFEIRDTNYISKLYPEYPYRKYHFFRFRNNLYYGNLTLSRHPILNSGNVSFPNSTNIAIFSDVKIHDDIVRIYNCHLESYNISLKKFVKSAFTADSDTENDFIIIHDRMRNSNKRRAEQVNRLLGHINQSSLPSIFCGDFNDTPLSYCYHSLGVKHKDTFQESGRGFGATYRTFWPLLRIDYVLVPQSSTVLEHKTLTDIKNSDHYPVFSRFSISKNENIKQTT